MRTRNLIRSQRAKSATGLNVRGRQSLSPENCRFDRKNVGRHHDIWWSNPDIDRRMSRASCTRGYGLAVFGRPLQQHRASAAHGLIMVALVDPRSTTQVRPANFLRERPMQAGVDESSCWNGAMPTTTSGNRRLCLHLFYYVDFGSEEANQ